jgi:hypothetical protein
LFKTQRDASKLQNTKTQHKQIDGQIERQALQTKHQALQEEMKLHVKTCNLLKADQLIKTNQH